MKLKNGEKANRGPTGKIELELELKLIEQLNVMEGYAKISKADLVTTALKRFISAHKDYFPEDYRGN